MSMLEDERKRPNQCHQSTNLTDVQKSVDKYQGSHSPLHTWGLSCGAKKLLLTRKMEKDWLDQWQKDDVRHPLKVDTKREIYHHSQQQTSKRISQSIICQTLPLR
jgi:ribosomal protein L11 methylase PrmA